MTNLSVYDPLIYQGQGIAASFMGQLYDVYRVGQNTSGSVIANRSLVIRSFQMYAQRTTLKSLLEGTVFDLLAYKATCDASRLKVGDILVNKGYGSDGSTFCVAHIRHANPFRVVLMRVETACSIERGHPSAGSSEDQPSSNVVVGRKYKDGFYGGETAGDRYHLTLDGGNYLILPQGQGSLATVQVGFQPMNRVKDPSKPEIPTRFYRTHFLAYMPPTPGYIPSELDIIKGANQDSYIITQMHYSEYGLQGTIATLEKVNT